MTSAALTSVLRNMSANQLSFRHGNLRMHAALYAFLRNFEILMGLDFVSVAHAQYIWCPCDLPVSELYTNLVGCPGSICFFMHNQ